MKVVFATETLALGINMPARTVVIEKLDKWNGETHADITPGEYTQLTGRAGRRGLDVEGHGVVLWQPGMNPRELAGLASTRTYPLRSSFAPSYNMAVNLVHQFGRERARELLELSFAQFQADKAVVGLARQLRKAEEALDGYAEAATCDRGDFMEYARMRQRDQRPGEGRGQGPPLRPARGGRQRRWRSCRPGDVIEVPSGKFAGYAVVVDPGYSGEGPRPLVVTAERQARRLSAVDFPTPVVALTRLKVPRNFSSRNPQMRRDLASALRTRTHDLAPPPPSRARVVVARARASPVTATRSTGCARDAARAPLPRLPRPRGPRPVGGAVVQARPGGPHPAAPGRGAHQHRRATVRPGVRGADGARLPRRRHRHRARAAADARSTPTSTW